MGKKDNIEQFPYDGTLTLRSEKATHSIEVPCLLSVKVKDQSPDVINGAAWINSALEPKSKAWLYCKFKSQKSDTGWQIQVEGDDLAALVAERVETLRGR